MLYKYMSAKHLIENLQKNWIKVTTDKDVNDPFEFAPFSYEGDIQKETLKRCRDKLVANNGIISFVKKWDHPLMWSHYADNHRGVCLGYEVLKWGNIDDVIYSDGNMLLPAVFENNDQQLPMQYQDLMLTKSSEWRYEEEVRHVVSLKECCQKDVADRPFYFYKTQTKYRLSEITLGMNCNKNLKKYPKALSKLNGTVEIFEAKKHDMMFWVDRTKIDLLAHIRQPDDVI